jgi:hypothetical protein
MLTSAFLLAMILVMIALMLNNIIYYNNIAYMGFMDQSGYDDVSIKTMVAEEASNAYIAAVGNPAAYDHRMQEFVRSLNNAVATKGYYVTLSSSVLAPIPTSGPDQTYTATRSYLYVNMKDSNRAYVINTTYTYHSPFTPTPTPTPTPSPGPSPQVLVVQMSSNKTTMVPDGFDCALVTVQVTDQATSTPVSGVDVDLHVSSGEFHTITGTPGITSVTTDVLGRGTVLYYPPLAVSGTSILNASAGTDPSRSIGNLSDNVTIASQIPPGSVCVHDVTIGTPTKATSKNKIGGTWFHWVTITIPITIPAGDHNFTPFSAVATFDSGTNMKLLAPSDITNIYLSQVKGPAAYNGNVIVKLNRPDDKAAYSADIILTVTGTCAEDGNAPYSKVQTLTVSGS